MAWLGLGLGWEEEKHGHYPNQWLELADQWMQRDEQQGQLWKYWLNLWEKQDQGQEEQDLGYEGLQLLGLHSKECPPEDQDQD